MRILNIESSSRGSRSASIAVTSAFVVYARGGTYAEDSPTPASRFDHQQGYIDFWLKFIGVKEVHTLVVEGTTWRGKEKGEESIARGQAEAKKLAADF